MVKQDYKKVVVMEEIKWKQKAKVQWLKKGDKNTKIFLRMATCSRNVNLISKPMINNEWVEDWEIIKSHVVHHFMDLYMILGIQGRSLMIWTLKFFRRSKDPS